MNTPRAGEGSWADSSLEVSRGDLLDLGWCCLQREYLLPSSSLGSVPEMLCDLRQSQNFSGPSFPHL